MRCEQPTQECLDATFPALADPRRRAIPARLASGEASVTDLGERLPRPGIIKTMNKA